MISITHKIFELDKTRWIAALTYVHKKEKKYIMVKKYLRKPEKPTNLTECLKLQRECELKFTMSGGNVFHRFTMRSVKNKSI